jgi:hypothetical protein
MFDREIVHIVVAGYTLSPATTVWTIPLSNINDQHCNQSH